MTTYKVSTDLIPLVDCCTYWGQFKPDYHFTEDYDFLDFDFDQYTDEIIRFLTPYFHKFAERFSREFFPIKINVVRFKSPKYYNYGGDIIYFDILTDVDLLQVIDKHYGLICDHIKSYQSEPGFINSMPNTIEKLTLAVSNDKERAIAAIIDALSDDLLDIFPDYVESCGADFEDFYPYQ